MLCQGPPRTLISLLPWCADVQPVIVSQSTQRPVSVIRDDQFRVVALTRHYRKYVETIMKKTNAKGQSDPQSKAIDIEGSSPQKHYSISERSRSHLTLFQWAYGKDASDPALRVRTLTGFP